MLYMFFDCLNIANIELLNFSLSSFDIKNAIMCSFLGGCNKLKNSPYFYYNKNDSKILHQIKKI